MSDIKTQGMTKDKKNISAMPTKRTKSVILEGNIIKPAGKGDLQGGIKEGRRLQMDIIAQCKKWTPELLKELYQIATIKNVKSRNKLHAIQQLLDRGWGKPKETVDTGITVLIDVPELLEWRQKEALPEVEVKALNSPATVKGNE